MDSSKVALLGQLSYSAVLPGDAIRAATGDEKAKAMGVSAQEAKKRFMSKVVPTTEYYENGFRYKVELHRLGSKILTLVDEGKAVTDSERRCLEIIITPNLARDEEYRKEYEEVRDFVEPIVNAANLGAFLEAANMLLPKLIALSPLSFPKKLLALKLLKQAPNNLPSSQLDSDHSLSSGLYWQKSIIEIMKKEAMAYVAEVNRRQPKL